MSNPNWELTPAMYQYYELKKQNSDSILFFRMWDFYEMFDDDAIIANKVLWIAITSRNKNASKSTPLAGIPFHAKEKYLPLLVDAWYKVAIAEQVSDPKLKWIVNREVVRVITPSTIWLEWENFENWNSNIIAITKNKKFGLSILNVWDNDWKCCEFEDFEGLKAELIKLNPLEVVLDKNLFWENEIKETLEKKYFLNIYYFQKISDWYSKLLKHFGTTNLEWFWIQELKEAQNASTLLLEYLENSQKTQLNFLNKISVYNTSSFIWLDEATIKNLDLVFNIATKSTKNWTLFWLLNQNKTSLWSRLLYDSILRPINNIEEIKKRQDFIEEFLSNKILLDKVRTELSGISNINWILNRIALNRTTPKDLLNLKKSLESIMNVLELINNSNSKKLKELIKQ